MTLIVNCRDKTLSVEDTLYPCRIGKGGFVEGAKGREGDAKTPLGTYHLRFGLYRADRLPRLNSSLTFRPLRQDDGWCDDVNDPAYNRFIRLPYVASHEKLWRKDGAYDIILVMSHNDSPPEPGLGSAVFIHIAQPDDRETLGCVALEPEVMQRVLGALEVGMVIEIH